MSSPNTIFPADIVNSSVEMHFQEYRPHYRGLYLMLLILFCIAFLMMFIIRVDISVRSTGIIKPLQERTEITSLVAGTVDSVSVLENDHVRAGQLLIKIVAGSVDEKNLTLDLQVKELMLQKKDLETLLKGNTSGLQSRLYQQQLVYYQQKKDEVSIKLKAAYKSFRRFKILYEEKVISPAEYEKYEYEYKTILNQADLLKEQEYSKWQSELTALNLQLEDLGSRQTLYSEEQDQYAIRAAATGFVQQLKGIRPGSYVQAGEMIGEISPDSGLLAEVYVMPKDIGYISMGSTVRMQIDAFDYNQWGLAEGKVVSVSRDVYIENGRPLFKVRCSLDNPMLGLKSGYNGVIKKGMTLQARFLVTRRSLYQLLYDKADDWLNPNIIPNES